MWGRVAPLESRLRVAFRLAKPSEHSGGRPHLHLLNVHDAKNRPWSLRWLVVQESTFKLGVIHGLVLLRSPYWR
jgi:hypothetical protein